VTGQRYATRDVDGQSVQFHKMTPYDRLEVAGEARKQARVALKERLAEVQATREETIGELGAFDAQHDHVFFYSFISSPAGRVQTYKRALGKSYAADKADEILRKLTLTEDEDEALMCELWGIPLPSKEDEGEETGPTTPAEKAPETDTYGSPTT